MLSQKPYQITEQQFEKLLQGIDFFHFKKKMAMFAFNTYTTHKWLALLMKYHCGINYKIHQKARYPRSELCVLHQ